MRAASTSPIPPAANESTSSSFLPVPPTFPPLINAQGEASLLTLTAQWTTEVFELVAVVTGCLTMLPAASVTSTRTRTFPGPKTIITAAFKPLCEALTSQLLVNHAHVAAGRARKRRGLLSTSRPLVSCLPCSRL